MGRQFTLTLPESIEKVCDEFDGDTGQCMEWSEVKSQEVESIR